jgi:hypothetical protein
MMKAVGKSKPVLPLIKAIGWNQAKARFQGIAEGGLFRNRLRPGVNHFVSDLGFFRPRMDESPTHQRKWPHRGILILPDTELK